MSQSSDYYEHRLDEAQEREYALEDKILKLESEINDVKTKIDEAIEKAVREHNIAIESLTERQTCEAFKQAIVCGDFQRLVIHNSGAQQVIYLPFAREQELMRRIRELEDALDKNAAE